MRRSWGVVVAVVCAGAVACATERGLIPGPGAPVLRADQSVAVQTDRGVRLFVDGDAWTGSPADLEEVMTPVRVTLENYSGQPVRIQYRNFLLVGGSGLRYEAICPFKIDRPGPARTSQIITPTFTMLGFFPSPYFARFYPGLRPWPYAFPYDGFYYDRTFVTWRAPLPSEDMIERALPEGVLEPGGMVSGFVYFNDVGDREKQVLFRAEVVGAREGKQVATVAIPFRVM